MRAPRNFTPTGPRPVRTAGLLVSLLIGLATLLLAPSAAEAHPLHSSAPAKQALAAGAAVAADTGTDGPGLANRTSLAGLGGGCSHAGLEVPRQTTPLHLRKAGRPLLPMGVKPARDIARTPPCPPPTGTLRVTLD